MNPASLLRELRLLKSQPGYRFCMIWGLVLIHLSLRAVALVAVPSWVVWKFWLQG